jgi:cilia- and flagella-associated protein 69
MYLDFDGKHEGVSLWTPAQLCSIQNQLLEYLRQIIPYLTSDFKEIQGFEYCMRFLAYTIESAASQHKSRVDITRQHESLLSNCLQIFLTLSELGPSSKRQLASLGIFPLLLGKL